MQCARSTARSIVRSTSALLVALGVGTAIAPSAHAQAITLDFGAGPGAPSICTTNDSGSGPLVLCSTNGSPVGSGGRVGQSYGDVPGVANVQYAELGNAFGRSLHWWNTGYGNLTNVLYSPSGSARIDLTPAAGKQITLNSFLLATFAGGFSTTVLKVFEIGGSEQYSFTATSFGGPTGQLFDFAARTQPLTSSTGLRIEWTQPTPVIAIDDLKFTVSDLAGPPSTVPEPATLALMATGLAMLGYVARRRRV